jgi:hypothetical protein
MIAGVSCPIDKILQLNTGFDMAKDRCLVAKRGGGSKATRRRANQSISRSEVPVFHMTPTLSTSFPNILSPPPSS